MKKRYPPVLRGKETGRIKRPEAVEAILYVRAAKRAAADAGETQSEPPPGGSTAKRAQRARRRTGH